MTSLVVRMNLSTIWEIHWHPGPCRKTKLLSRTQTSARFKRPERWPYLLVDSEQVIKAHIRLLGKRSTPTKLLELARKLVAEPHYYWNSHTNYEQWWRNIPVDIIGYCIKTWIEWRVIIKALYPSIKNIYYTLNFITSVSIDYHLKHLR